MKGTEFEVGAPGSTEIFNDAIVNDISCSQDTMGLIILDLSVVLNIKLNGRVQMVLFLIQVR